MAVLPGAEPFHHDGGPVGVLLCHGFTGSPQSLRPWAEHLAKAGFSVSLPLLPGHGTTWQDLNRSRWPQWYAAVNVALSQLLTRCDAVVVAGLSMGGALALRLAQQRGGDVAGVILVNPAVKSEGPARRSCRCCGSSCRRCAPSVATSRSPESPSSPTSGLPCTR